MHWAFGAFGDGNWWIPDKQGPEGIIFIYFLDSVNNQPCLQLLFYVKQQKTPSPSLIVSGKGWDSMTFIMKKLTEKNLS